MPFYLYFEEDAAICEKCMNTIAYYKSCGIWRNDLRQEIFLDNELFKTW